MGQINVVSVEPRGNKTADEYMNYLANVLAMNQDEFVNILEGRLSSVNIREIAGFLVDLLTLKHKSGLVGMSAANPNNADAVRIWSGSADMYTAPWRVLQNGDFYATNAFITGLITGSTIIGSEIKTSETDYPRIELSSLGTFFKAFGSATKSIEISVSSAGTPGLFFKDGAGTALMDISSGVFDILTTIALAISAPNVSAGGDWSFEKIITGSITGNAGSANYADRAGTAAAADGLAPSGTVAWGQVDKSGSSLSHIQTRNLADLTQTPAYRTVTDGEKSTWSAKASTSYVDTAVATKANKTQESYTTATLLNGWENFSPSFQPPSYYKNEFGEVRVTGFVKSGSISYGIPIFTLPAGYRPSLIQPKNATSQNSSSDYVAATVEVRPNGDVVVGNNVGSTWLVLDFSFRAEQ